MEIMGIVNVTPDSFSDGGKWSDPQAAIAHGRDLIAAGASILDIGGESTRPGATALSPDEEWTRIEPVVSELSPHVTVSVDTYHSETARRAAKAGAKIINDVTGGQGDPQMFEVVSALDVDYILQHGRGNAANMNDLAVYSEHVATELTKEMLRSRGSAVAAGISPERIILDPGLGFAKVGDQDWDALGGLEEYLHLGHRVLIGPSRKRFLAGVSQASVASERDLATAVLSAMLADAGVWAVRVHNVAATATAIAVHERLWQAETNGKICAESVMRTMLTTISTF